MAYQLISKTTKPANALFWATQYPFQYNQEVQWLQSQPGFVSRTVDFLDYNTAIAVLTFDSKDSYDAMAALRSQRTGFIARNSYNQINNIVVEILS